MLELPADVARDDASYRHLRTASRVLRMLDPPPEAPASIDLVGEPRNEVAVALDVGVMAARRLAPGLVREPAAPDASEGRRLRAMDLMLDVVAAPDLSWWWKDREEFERILERRVFEPDLGDQVMGEALRVIDDLEHRRPPFDGDRPSWRPDAAWGVPILPPGWDEIQL